MTGFAETTAPSSAPAAAAVTVVEVATEDAGLPVWGLISEEAVLIGARLIDKG